MYFPGILKCSPFSGLKNHPSPVYSKVTEDPVKDEHHKKGDPIYQSIDYSKLVPLLTAALQEETAKREALEARVAALEGS